MECNEKAEKNQPSIQSRGIIQNSFEGVKCIRPIDYTTSHSPVICIEFVPVRGLSPEYGNHSHCEGNCTDAIIWDTMKNRPKRIQDRYHTNIAIRRTHGKRGDAEDSLDNLAGPAKLSNNLRVGQRS